MDNSIASNIQLCSHRISSAFHETRDRVRIVRRWDEEESNRTRSTKWDKWMSRRTETCLSFRKRKELWRLYINVALFTPELVMLPTKLKWILGFDSIYTATLFCDETFLRSSSSHCLSLNERKGYNNWNDRLLQNPFGRPVHVYTGVWKILRVWSPVFPRFPVTHVAPFNDFLVKNMQIRGWREEIFYASQISSRVEPGMADLHLKAWEKGKRCLTLWATCYMCILRPCNDLKQEAVSERQEFDFVSLLFSLFRLWIFASEN